jgi:hypothetical protein
MIQGVHEKTRLSDFRFGQEQQDLILEDCELSVSEIGADHLTELKKMSHWIVRFAKNARQLAPLFIALHFSEKAYAEEDPRIRS